ncbi:MAG: ATP-dependent metallopeptidase FtsH/Yme1/Tma family protein [Planctomycetota bacterium]|nr:MAG: ATP-dependent metallopeptidase FtsH/Yme1/Tma family protein [Planctomycetota bacterium]
MDRMTKTPEPMDNDNRRDNRKGDAPRGGVAMIAVMVVIMLVAAIVWNSLSSAWHSPRVDYSTFLTEVEAGNVRRVRIDGLGIQGEWVKIPPARTLADGKTQQEYRKEFTTSIPMIENRELLETLLKGKAEVATSQSSPSGWIDLVGTLIMISVSVFILLFIMRRSQDPFGGGGMFGSFTRSQAKRFAPSEIRTTFDDVAGMENAKRELQEIVEFLKDPAKFQRLGAQIPKGVLMMGSPGTGKTLMARAVAGEAGVPFFAINGSEFIQMFVGVGASRVRDLFRTAKENSPSIMFIDEIDAVGRVRGAGFGGGHDEREQTLNQILSEMDGFAPTESVIVIAATNRPDVLDPALLRPGRFDRHVTVERPTRKGRVGVLKVHSRKVPLADDVNLEEIAAGTIGFSGADLKNLVNEAALLAARENKTVVDRLDFEAAKDKIVMGAKRDEILNDHEKRMTAYHEAGHALLGWLLPDVDPVHKVTIVPRGRALGVTYFQPNEERMSMGEKQMHSQLVMSMGGRVAEKLVFDEYTAGAQGDLKSSTSLARKMIGQWGMSDKIGPVAFRDGEENPFLGKELHEQRQYSEQTAAIIDAEVQRFLSESQDEARRMLIESRDKLDIIANALLEQELVEYDDLVKLIGPDAPRTHEPAKKDE